MIAAELIANIGVDGLGDFESAMSAAGSATLDLQGIMTASFKAISISVLAGLAAGGAAFAAFTTAAVQEATKIDLIRQSFAGIFDNPEKGDKLVAWIRELGRSSRNTSDDLLEFSLRGEMAGANMTKWLPILDAASRGNKEQLRQFVDGIIRGSTGQNMGLAMKPFRQLGIGANDLKAEGITVTAGNKIVASADQWGEAMLRILHKKFDKLGPYLAKTMSVQFVDLQDSWLQLLDAFGRGWFPLIGAMLTSAQNFVNFLTDTGEIGKLGKAFADAFGSVFGNVGGQRALVMFLTYVITALEMMPSIIVNVGNLLIKVGRAAFEFIDKAFTSTLNSALSMFMGLLNIERQIVHGLMQPIIAFQNFSKGFWGGKLSPLGQSVLNGATAVSDATAKPLVFEPYKGIGDLIARGIGRLTGSELLGAPGQFQKTQQAMLKAYDDYMKKPKGSLDSGEGNGLWNSRHVNGPDSTLNKIESHTSKVAAHMEAFKRFALGGGDRANGIAVSELYGRAGAGPRSLSIHVSGAHGSALQAAVSQIAMDAIQDYRRSGGH